MVQVVQVEDLETEAPGADLGVAASVPDDLGGNPARPLDLSSSAARPIAAGRLSRPEFRKARRSRFQAVSSPTSGIRQWSCSVCTRQSVRSRVGAEWRRSSFCRVTSWKITHSTWPTPFQGPAFRSTQS